MPSISEEAANFPGRQEAVEKEIQRGEGQLGYVARKSGMSIDAGAPSVTVRGERVPLAAAADSGHSASDVARAVDADIRRSIEG